MIFPVRREFCLLSPALTARDAFTVWRSILVAQTQGQLGYMIESTLDTELMKLGIAVEWPFSCAGVAAFDMGERFSVYTNILSSILLTLVLFSGPYSYKFVESLFFLFYNLPIRKRMYIMYHQTERPLTGRRLTIRPCFLNKGDYLMLKIETHGKWAVVVFGVVLALFLG